MSLGSMQAVSVIAYSDTFQLTIRLVDSMHSIGPLLSVLPLLKCRPT